ncbi:MAG: hypothetical protein JWM55_569 [Acidimicrobiaceae bacterium]|nr:hypothetical protein [Acidimicrobiaceae bacterium]
MPLDSHRSAIFAFADTVVEEDAAFDPLFATGAGLPGYDDQLPDFSPDRATREIDLVRGHLAALSSLAPIDDIDRIALAVLQERLSSRLGLLESGESARIFSVIWSPLSEIRQIFELMPTGSPDELDVIARRLRAVRPALGSWRTSLEALAAARELPARRHVVGVAQQAATYSEGAFADFVSRVAPASSSDSELHLAALDADDACGQLSSWMFDALEPVTTNHDACGAPRYAAWANYWTGATLDFEELYAWGWSDLQRINGRMWEIARELLDSPKSLVEATEYLDHDPAQIIAGPEELLRRLIAFTERAVNELDGVHFDIDPRIRFCDARLAPEGSAAAPYYIPPSEDLSRPGTTWFPTLGATTFPWWSHASTWYHEGVPGHHLQCATSLLEADRQSRFHRLEAWTSGYGEGWALYAERLMNELGYFSDLGEEMGYLSGQSLRAARVMVDIGLHFELAAPRDLGELSGLGDCSGKVWTAEMAIAVLEERAMQSHEMSVSEVDRYLGMPGQAISYKVGERTWMRAREAAKTRLGPDFSLKRFHAYALALGPMGLDSLEDELTRWDGW